MDKPKYSNLSSTVLVQFKGVLRAVKEDFFAYYSPLTSRKAAQPICAVLCISAIVTYALLYK
jgi:hypothetical protein